MLSSFLFSVTKTSMAFTKPYLHQLTTTRNIRSKGGSIFTKLGAGFGQKIFGKEEVDPGKVEGTDLRILKYPHPKLRNENDIIISFDDEIKDIASQMLKVMYAAEGIGLAAPQVGINKRLMVFNEEGDINASDKEMILCNPKIINKSDEKLTKEEGCLSFPQIYGQVDRFAWIEIEYNSIHGDIINERLEGFPARIFQHEYDHLDKILFIDRIHESDRDMNQKKLDKLIKKYGPGGAV